MNDSFSLLAKSIRQNKINKNELLNNLKEIKETQYQKDYYIRKVIYLQKIIRGHLFRIKYGRLLDEINIKTIIDYLYEKKKKRIHSHKDEIISFFVSKYINKQKRRKNSILLEQYKIHCINLIKAYLKGILIRKNLKEKLDKIRKAKKLIFKHILTFRTILILKSNTIQNLLCDIAKIKYQLKNCSNEKSKELRNKLSKNINLFYDTYFYAKDNCNWGNEKKDDFFEEKWYKKYFEIINTNKNDEKNKNGGNDEIFFFEKNNSNNDINIYSSNKRLRNQTVKSSKIIPKNLSESVKNKIYENQMDILEFNIENQENFVSQKNKNKYRYSLQESNNGISYRENSRRFISDKNLKIQIQNIDLNNINNKLFYSSKKINGFVPNEEVYPKSTNNYYQLEEREIKPLKTKDILNCQNPFGKREATYKKANTLKQSKENLFSKQDNIYSKRNSAKIINRDEKPIGGNKINYNELFGQDGELIFEGDPFGGAKQFETKKDKINNISKSSKINNKKPVYDARKAIEEAKMKEENKNGEKKEKHNEFREFIREMKKLNCNDIKNDFNKNNKKDNSNKNNELNLTKKYSENINSEIEDKINGINIYEPRNMNDYFEGKKEINKNMIKEDKIKKIKREKSANKSSNQILRKRLHELEKTPAPALNKKGIKSKINCWFNQENTKTKNDKNKIENFFDMKLLQLNSDINKISNDFNIDSYFNKKEEKMKKFRNVPYIKQDYKYVNYVKNIDINEYENLLNDINKEYKILK